MYRFFLALRWLASRPINLLGVLGVTAGVWALIVVVSIFSGYKKTAEEHIRSARADLSVHQPYLQRISADDLAAELMADPEVVGVAPRMFWYGMVHPPTRERPKAADTGPNLGDEIPFLQLIGIDPVRESETMDLASWLAAPDPVLRAPDPDRALATVDGVPSILLSESRMQRLGLRPGDEVRITSGSLQRGEDAGSIRSEAYTFRVGGAFRSKHLAFDFGSALVALDVLADMLDLDPQDRLDEIAIALRDPEAADSARDRVARTLGRATGDPNAFARVRTWEQQDAQFLRSIEHQSGLMKLVLIVILVVAAFLMLATLSMMVTEKTRDVGILTAMGASPLGVLQVFLWCGLTISGVGTVLGLVVGAISAVNLDAFNKFMIATWDVDLFPTRVYHLDRVPYHLDPVWMAQVALMAMATGLVVSTIPALRAALQDPVRPLRHE